jgi:hypothetical protein
VAGLNWLLAIAFLANRLKTVEELLSRLGLRRMWTIYKKTQAVRFRVFPERWRSSFLPRL